MLSLENIISQFALYASLDIPEAELYSPICEGARDTIISSLKPNVDIAMHATRLEAAASVTAYYRYILLQSSENFHDIKVGEIQLKPSSDRGLSAAEGLKNEILSSMSDLIAYDGAFFRKV